MPREYKIYLKDILNAIQKIEKYTENIDFNSFCREDLIQDGVIRNLEIIGEAVKHLPPSIKNKYPETEWKKIAGLRDILIHTYFGIDVEIIWDIIQNEIPKFHMKIDLILKDL